MGKLTNLKPAMRTLSSSLAFSNGKAETERRIMAPPTWKRWYHTKPWAKLRKAILIRDGFTCQMCHKMTAKSANLVADHKKPHRGNAELFWDINNIWTLCAPCHSSRKQREEQSTPQGVWD